VRQVRLAQQLSQRRAQLAHHGVGAQCGLPQRAKSAREGQSRQGLGD
jgi:hypothetical protein